ncbi:hypothetical protein BTJ40_03815 [Microbulbifer sp. A4B17]|nr:hypothetical protein BTJ40_03815 [Microbulbifer sp. A4B17]
MGGMRRVRRWITPVLRMAGNGRACGINHLIARIMGSATLKEYTHRQGGNKYRKFLHGSAPYQHRADKIHALLDPAISQQLHTGLGYYR